MSFNIHQSFLDQDGYYLEDVAETYRETILQRFASSPEGKAYLKGEEVDWADMFMDVLIRRLGFSLAHVYTDTLREILYDIIPASVVIDPQDVPELIAELQAFYQFLKREFSLHTADVCLRVLNQKNLVKRMTDELNNPDNYSPTKSILMQMMDEGVDVSDQGQVTEKAQAQHKAVKSLIHKVCNAHLNMEYYDMSLKLLDQFLFLYADRLERGQAKSWAAAIVYTIGRVNFLFDPNQTPHLSAGELCQKFSISQGTASKKSTELFDLFDLMQFDPEWTLPSLIDNNPFIWMVMIDGFLVDIRTQPRELQVSAYEQGVIPYIPADKT